MKNTGKIFALILLIPVLGILLHAYIPHHHHDYCLEQIHQNESPLKCDSPYEEDADHNESCCHHDLNHLPAEDPHQNLCHIHIEYRLEKIVIEFANNPENHFFFLPNQKTFIPNCYKNPSIDQLLIFHAYLRGPPNCA
ncbi:DUF6769 family protein [Bacteroidota bacterium]